MMTRIKIAIMSASSIMMVTLAMSPILAMVAKTYSSAPTSTVQMILVLPGLIAVPFSLVAGKVATFIPKKTILLAAMAVMFAGGLVPFVFHASITPLVVASAVIGVGLGFMIPISSALISDHFEGQQRGALFGVQSAVINAGGMLTVILAGLFAKIDWLYAYSVFLLILPAMLVVALLLPKDRVVKQPDGNGFRLNPAIAYLTLTACTFGMLITTYNTNVAMYLDSSRLGDVTSAGVATSLLSGAGIVAGLLFGRVFKAFKGFTYPAAIGLSAAGLSLAFMGGSLPVVLAGGFLCGYGFSTVMPFGVFQATQAVPPAASAFAIAIFTGSVSIGSFISPFVINELSRLSGYDSAQTRFLVGAVGLLVLFAATLIKEYFTREQVAQPQLQN
jgi:MFS family permease